MTSCIEVESLKKEFGKKVALQQVDLRIYEGEIFGLLGPSGAGKTTMIKLLTGELDKTAGNISVLGLSPKDFKTADFKSQMGLLSDNSALYERLTVYDNLKLFARLYNAPLHHIEETLEMVNMLGEQNTSVNKLSKGMKQRVLLAKAIIHRPTLIFLDEPTSALDPTNVEQIHRVLKKLNKAGATIFLNTHNMEEATNLCDRVAFLHEGEIKELASPSQLRYQYSSHEFHIETFSGEHITLKNSAENAEQIADLIRHNQIKMMHTDHPTLGDIFMEVTGKELV
ncbi:MAG TPA: ABC transporter ATP-binding protein [Virgibacillus sp.]|nr:ABC transporter ATP-binding protein [Virgibacillus sp.]